MTKKKFDFGGYVTKANVKCTDGRTILPNAFKHHDGQTVPLVWQHGHDDPTNVLGHVLLENREDGVYGYGSFNETDAGNNAKSLVQHRDIESLSIWANRLVEKSKEVAHGFIREVSLVLSGANPGAKIDNVVLAHQDGSETELDDEAIIHSGEEIDIDMEEEEEGYEEEELDLDEVAELMHAGDETVADVFKTLNAKQRAAVTAIVEAITEEEDDDSAEHSDNDDEEGEGNTMKHNVFDSTGQRTKAPRLTHSDYAPVFERARNLGSLRRAVEESDEVIQHAADHLAHSITNIDYLFPEARVVGGEPSFLTRKPSGWVSKVMGAVRKSPFSRIKTRYADLTPDAARAKGYVTGAAKVEEVIAMLTRTTTPTTVYKLQKLDRDDIVDITDFNVVAWMKREMRMMLDEELSRAILIGDGRSAGADKIDETMIRPIYNDDTAYAHLVQVDVSRTDDQLIDDLITARLNYRGSGQPSLYVSPTQLTNWLLLKDADGRRLYRTVAELASELRVKEIVEVPVMENVQKTGTPNYDLRAIMVNLTDYTAGADKGGEVNMFDDFDIDYNKYSYLIETRMSGALTEPKSAIVLEQADA